MYQEVGWSALVGFSVLVVFMPVIGILTAKMGTSQTQALKQTDTRVSLLSSFLTAIKTVKYYAWEGAMKERVESEREREIERLKRFGQFKAVGFSVFLISPFFASVCTFLVYSAAGGEWSILPLCLFSLSPFSTFCLSFFYINAH